MINFKASLIVLISVILIGCGGTGESQQEPQSETEAVAETTATADSIVNKLDESSQKLQSISEETQRAIDELSEDN